jgi:cytochrome c-type biogenesis protein CcmH/NrfF
MSFKIAGTLMAASIFVAASGFASASKPSAKSVGEGLLCQCGCNTQVSERCQHGDQCPSHKEMRAAIQKEIDDGKDETAILQDFVHQYGIQVLATPPARGFYLTVWILPALCVPLGLVLVIVFVRRWRKPGEESLRPPDDPIDPRAIAAMEEELKRVTG